jgi:hypothetical protein
MAGHEHTKRCYWDYRIAAWVCRAERPEDDEVAEFPALEVSFEAPVAAGADAK